MSQFGDFCISGLGGGVALPVITFEGTSAINTGGSSRTFTAVDIGDEASDRVVVVCTHTAMSAGSCSVSSVTIGGVSATVVSGTNPTSGFNTSIWWAEVPTGATADIAVVWSASSNCGYIETYRITGLTSSTPLDGDSVVTTPDLTLTTQDGGVAIFAATRATAAAFTWTDAIEDNDVVMDTAYQETCAHISGTANGTDTASVNNTGAYRFSGASWR